MGAADVSCVTVLFAFTIAVMSRTSPLRPSLWHRAFNAAVVLTMLVVGTLAVDRATAHAATAAAHNVPMAAAQAAQLPCHRLHHADGLALTPVNACDTVCAGSAPESSYEAVPVRFGAVLPVAAFVATQLPPAPRNITAAALHYGHGPPPLSSYLRDRRLLI